jgi:protein-disulfide isomerase
MTLAEPPRLAVPIGPEDHVQGPGSAPITLVQYGDYECPYTRMSRHSVRALEQELGDTLRFVFRHFPLADIHPHARAAALAAEAAATQSEPSFWAMHEQLFGHQEALEDADLRRYAADLSLDVARFDRDRKSSATASHIDRDVTGGERSGVEGTPTFFINGVRHDGPYDTPTLRAAIASAQRGIAPPDVNQRLKGTP